MEQANVKDKSANKPSLTLERHYPVAPEKVWRAWTDPQTLAKWWGPGGEQPVSVVEIDLRVGGRLRMVFGGAQGKDHECAGIYREVVPNRKLVFTWCWPNSTPDRVSQVTILFTPSGSGTACSAGSTTYSAAVPNGRPHAAFHVHTRSPTRASATPAPTASIVTAPSLCGTMRGNGGVPPAVPRRDLTSDGFTPDHAIRTRTSPGPGAGVGSSPSWRTSAAAPNRS